MVQIYSDKKEIYIYFLSIFMLISLKKFKFLCYSSNIKYSDKIRRLKIVIFMYDNFVSFRSQLYVLHYKKFFAVRLNYKEINIIEGE